jgi:TRAP-type transport system small permease protein
MARLADAFGRLYVALATLAAGMLLAMVLVVTADIVLRNTMRFGFVWANEVSEYALYLTTLFAAPWLLRQGRHVRLDLVLTMVPQRIAWRMEVAADIIGFLVCVVLVRYAVTMTYDSWLAGSITIKNLVFPEWWMLAPLPIVLALLAIEFAFRLHRLFIGDRTRRIEATYVD